MSLPALLYFYRRRLRSHPVQEALAGLGIAIGVALVFAVQVANSSITASSRQIVHSVTGSSALQLRARSAAGFDEALAERAKLLPGVASVSPELYLTASVFGPSGRSLELQAASASGATSVALARRLGINLTTRQPTSALSRLAGELQSRGPASENVALPSAAAQLLGVSRSIAQRSLRYIELRVRGRAYRVKVGAILGPQDGEISSSLAVFAALPLLQRLSNMPGRVSTLLVRPKPGDLARVRAGLERLAAGKLTVAPASYDVDLLEQAAAPNGDATGFFAFVSGLVGLLLAFSAMLLSAPERRRTIAELRIQGTSPLDLVKLLMFQALCLGLVSSVVGVLAGNLLARDVFHETPGYLAAAFPLGTQTIVGWRPVVLALLGGVAATCLAAAPPLLDLRRGRAVDGIYFEQGEPGHAISERARVWLFFGALILLGSSAGLLLLVGTSVSVPVIMVAALATLLAIPFSFSILVTVAQLVALRSKRLNMLLVATRALRATSIRSLALAATGAIAMFGSVAAQGAHNDLLQGLYRDYRQYVSTADVWVANAGDELATNSFPAAGLPARIARVHGVSAVRSYQGGFLDVDGQRAWVIARSPRASSLFPSGQLVEGDARVATARLRSGGWITVSQQLARTADLTVGKRLTLPTPTGQVSYRLAGVTSNLGWSGGAITMNDSDYQRAWASADPTALEVDVSHGASSLAVKGAIERVLGSSTGLRVQTSSSRAAQADVLAREGLSRLSEIRALLIVAAALAMAAAMGASIWQRRASLASLRIQSFRPSQLRIVLLSEALLVLGIGCATGAVTGVYGHLLIDRYLRVATGFPAPFSTTLPGMLETVGAIVGAALLVLAIPGFIASRVPARLALQE